MKLYSHILYLLIIPGFIITTNRVLLPVQSENRRSLQYIKLTENGVFGEQRAARPGIPAHLHTGIDISRPSGNYDSEPVFPISEGIVISKRTDGPFAQLIIEHHLENRVFWSLYEHIAGITINPGDVANPEIPMARFMNKAELDHYGWQFNHLHLEILKVKPQAINPSVKTPERYFTAYSLICYSPDELNNFYYNPVKFFTDSWMVQEYDNGTD